MYVDEAKKNALVFRCLCFAARFGLEMFGGYFVIEIALRMVVQKSLSGVAKAETI